MWQTETGASFALGVAELVSVTTEKTMIHEPKQSDIDTAFDGLNFGPFGETPEGRKTLVVHCILKRACGYRDGGTIEAICKELGLLTKKGTPRLRAKQWAYVHIGLMCTLHTNEISVNRLRGFMSEDNKCYQCGGFGCAHCRPHDKSNSDLTGLLSCAGWRRLSSHQDEHYWNEEYLMMIISGQFESVLAKENEVYLTFNEKTHFSDALKKADEIYSGLYTEKH